MGSTTAWQGRFTAGILRDVWSQEWKGGAHGHSRKRSNESKLPILSPHCAWGGIQWKYPANFKELGAVLKQHQQPGKADTAAPALSAGPGRVRAHGQGGWGSLSSHTLGAGHSQHKASCIPTDTCTGVCFTLSMKISSHDSPKSSRFS